MKLFLQDKSTLIFLKLSQLINLINEQNNIGNCYRDGNGVAVDFNKAFFWFIKAAESDNVFGQHSLGEMFINGFGVKKSLKDAAYWFNKTHNNPFKNDLAKDDVDLLDKLWANNELSKYLE